MNVRSFINVAAFAAVTVLSATSSLAQITIPTVQIGNPGNAADPLSGRGSVAYTYSIGRTEVTTEQYVAFLNAKAASDPFGLYNPSMGTGRFGSITRSGSAGSYTYSAMNGRQDHPVFYVSFWDAARFVNWLNNGQGNSDTENGTYTLTALGIEFNTINRNANAQWAVTSENEWYKAAYHQPAGQGGDADDYWLFPTAGNTIDTSQANYRDQFGDTRAVGSYAANYYGTFDMAGNVWEWTESNDGPYRGIRGGGFNTSSDFFIRSDNSFVAFARDEGFGFRVTQIPGPSSVALLAFGAAVALRRRVRTSAPATIRQRNCG